MGQGFIGQTQFGNERRIFHVHSCLGRGGFGEVYRATMESGGGVATEVAIKVLRSDIDPGSDSVKRLRDEGRLLGKLSHPSIVKVHDLVLLDNRVSLVTEFIDGEDLDSCFKGAERLPARALVIAIGEVAAALQAAWASPSHTTGKPLQLIHRDVKPANIRIGRHGEVKLLDFGIARAGNAVREAQTAANAMMGSYLYMAPERFHEDDVQPPSDVFALGTVLYEGLAGERFFAGLSLQQVYAFMLSPSRFRRRLEERVAELSLDVPEEVLSLLGDMMHADPDQRPTAGEISHRCEDLGEKLPGATLKRWCRNHGWPDTGEHRGSLDGRVLTAGTVGTMEPAPHRSGYVPAPVSAHIPSSPPVPEYTPPVPASPPTPQSLGPAPTLENQRLAPTSSPDDPTEEVAKAPATPTLQPASYAGDSLGFGEPGLGDMSGAHADAGGGGHVLSFGLDDETDDTDVVDDEAAFDAALANIALRRQRWTRLLLGLGLFVILAAVTGVVGLTFVAQSQSEGQEIPLEAPVDGAAVDAAPEDGTADALPDGEAGARDDENGAPEDEEGAADDAPQDDGTADEIAPEPEATPEPDPEPAPEPVAAPAPKAPTTGSLVARGWDKVSGDPEGAKALFQKALDIQSSHGDANYGMGYVFMQQGNPNQAIVFFCKALASGDSGVAGEVSSIMASNSLACP